MQKQMKEDNALGEMLSKERRLELFDVFFPEGIHALRAIVLSLDFQVFCNDSEGYGRLGKLF